MITFKQKGDFSKTLHFMEKSLKLFKMGKFDAYGEQGVNALRDATPRDTGKTADSWRYKVTITAGYASISFYNENIVDNVNIAVILQYGHATANGGFVQGIDYINPAVKPIFDKIANDMWGELKR